MHGEEGFKQPLKTSLLRPGDTLFVYTDGVTEATDAKPSLYGDTRLLGALNGARGGSLRDLLLAVKADIDAFAGGVPQFDDITMLAIEYRGAKSEAQP